MFSFLLHLQSNDLLDPWCEIFLNWKVISIKEITMFLKHEPLSCNALAPGLSAMVLVIEIIKQ